MFAYDYKIFKMLLQKNSSGKFSNVIKNFKDIIKIQFHLIL